MQYQTSVGEADVTLKISVAEKSRCKKQRTLSLRSGLEHPGIDQSCTFARGTLEIGPLIRQNRSEHVPPRL